MRCPRRWSYQWRGEGEEGGGEATRRWDCAGVPAGLSRGGLRRQPPVSWPGSLPAQVWQLLFTLALQECLLQSLLHQISLATDTRGAEECGCSYVICAMAACVCCVGVTESYQICSRQNHQRVTKRHLEPEFWTNIYVPFVSQVIHSCYSHPALRGGVCNPVLRSPPRLCSAHIDQDLGLCSHIVFYNLTPWPLSVLTPQPTPSVATWLLLTWVMLSRPSVKIWVSTGGAAWCYWWKLKCKCTS